MEQVTRAIQLGRHIRHVGRLAQIANVLARNGLWSVLEAVGIQRILTPEQVREAEEAARREGSSPDAPGVVDPHSLPVRLRKSLEVLGPAFVKLGQMLAVREDLLPPSFIEELRRLHHQVLPLPYAQIRKVLEEEIGDKGLQEFEWINETPLAAGSIGQVHEARLKDGRRIVVKVQRPGIASQIQVDLGLMETMAALLERYVSETRSIRPKVIVQELARAITGELDFIREAGNMTKVAANFGGTSYVHVPEVIWPLTTARVLTQSYLEGVTVWDREAIIKSGLAPSVLVERGFSIFLQMVFVDGMYHGDLHPGNLLALPDNQVGLLDFGVVIRLGRLTREHLAGLLVALVREDFEMMSTHFAELCEPGPDFDLEAFQHEVSNAVAPFMGLRLAEARSGRLLWEVAKIAARQGAPLPRDLVLFVKTLVTFEGIGSHLEPGFDVVKSAQKFTEKIVKDMYSPESLRHQGFLIARDVAGLARHAPYQIRRLLKAAGDGDLSIQVTSDDLGRVGAALDRSSSRVAVAVIVAALIVGSSILAFSKLGNEVFHMSQFGVIGFALAGFLGLYLIWSILRGGRF